MNNWTDVTKELPKEETPVLVFFKNRLGKGEIGTGQYSLPRRDEEGYCWFREIWISTIDRYEYVTPFEKKITHWMPLPRSPIKPIEMEL